MGMICAICQGNIKPIGYGVSAWTKGCSAWPIKGEDDRCCQKCGDKYVLPTRIAMKRKMGQQLYQELERKPYLIADVMVDIPEAE